MMSLTMIGCSGSPGCGKSTVFRKLIESTGGELAWFQIKEKLLVYHENMEKQTIILGDYSRQAGVFGGTDKLSMAVQKEAVAAIKKWNRNSNVKTVLFEGDRLWNSSFLTEIKNLGIQMNLIELTASPKILAARHKDRKDTQTEKWLKSRETKLANIRKSWPQIKSLPNEDTEQMKMNVEYLLGLLEGVN